ncbi:hypothetical protein DSO57_1032069 [Entomophthora muscae]|uniref:Uncharacterized protein n=1 Tax=Entomophthora muscae TaxID=34485 RepID=A0ACC2TBJ3_9FUNG|nr:hypothetical protein DSO57_1032069 [Entomophthora muscae]
MQDDNKPYYPLSSYSNFPYLTSNLSDQASDFGFVDQSAPLSSPPNQTLASMQEQINNISLNLIASGLMVAGQTTPPAAPLFDPMMSLYFPSAVPLLPSQYLGHPSSPLQDNLLSDFIQYPSSPAPTPASAQSTASPPSSLSTASVSPVLAPLPKPVSKPSPVKSKSQPSQSAKRTREPTVFDEDFENDPIRPGEDMVARKRRQNTMAARRSRMRKVAKLEDLERTVSQLEKDKIQLETRLAVMESEKLNANQRAQENLDRIRTLEAQLLEAYKSRS